MMRRVILLATTLGALVAEAPASADSGASATIVVTDPTAGANTGGTCSGLFSGTYDQSSSATQPNQDGCQTGYLAVNASAADSGSVQAGVVACNGNSNTLANPVTGSDQDYIYGNGAATGLSGGMQTAGASAGAANDSAGTGPYCPAQSISGPFQSN